MKRSQSGFGLIEVMISLAVLLIGVTAILQLQTRLQKNVHSAYEMTQAMMLVKDMASRLESNRLNANSYIGTTGTGSTCTADTSTIANIDLGQWCQELQGASETSGANNAGGVIGARGCVTTSSEDDTYLVSVAWQGQTPTSAPIGNTCGQNAYEGGETYRRVFSTKVRFGAF